jgi:hypothetical protein
MALLVYVHGRKLSNQHCVRFAAVVYLATCQWQVNSFVPHSLLQVATEVVLGSNLETWIVHCKRDKEVRNEQLRAMWPASHSMLCSVV